MQFTQRQKTFSGLSSSIPLNNAGRKSSSVPKKKQHGTIVRKLRSSLSLQQSTRRNITNSYPVTTPGSSKHVAVEKNSHSVTVVKQKVPSSLTKCHKPRKVNSKDILSTSQKTLKVSSLQESVRGSFVSTLYKSTAMIFSSSKNINQVLKNNSNSNATSSSIQNTVKKSCPSEEIKRKLNLESSSTTIAGLSLKEYGLVRRTVEMAIKVIFQPQFREK